MSINVCSSTRGDGSPCESPGIHPYDGNLYCDLHIERFTLQEEKKPIKFNKDLLNEICQNSGASLIGAYVKFNRDQRYKYICQCGNEEERCFRDMYKKGAYCHACIYSKASKERDKTVQAVYGVPCVSEIPTVKEKRVQTNLKNRGTTCPLKSEEVKKKIRATNIARYGVESPRKLQEVKDKAIATCLVKYGTDNPLKADTVKEKVRETNIRRYGAENPFAAEKIKKKICETNLKKLGVAYPGQSEEIKDKIKATNLERLGVAYPGQSAEVKEKIAETNLERHGVKYTFQAEKVKKKIKDTNISRYGVDVPTKNPEIYAKIRVTNKERYGVENPQQSPEIQEKTQKTGKRFKEYVCPSGTVRKVQGYEPFALNILFGSGYTEDQVLTDRRSVPRITYTRSEKKHYYFPDIYIPHENRVIEVKSVWTYNYMKELNIIKATRTQEEGYLYEFWCFNCKGERIDAA